MDRATLKRLADRFPGCLRELDLLGLPELERRARHLAGRDPEEPWVIWIAGYHRIALAALAIKRVVGRVVPVDPSVRSGLAELASQTAGTPLDDAFVQQVARPPEGRLGPLLLRRLATSLGVDPQLISSTLFPGRRPPPYSL